LILGNFLVYRSQCVSNIHCDENKDGKQEQKGSAHCIVHLRFTSQRCILFQAFIAARFVV